MKIRTHQIYHLVNQDFGGNLAGFCRALGLSYTTVWRALTGRSSGSLKFLPALYHYCKKNERNLGQYIE